VSTVPAVAPAAARRKLRREELLARFRHSFMVALAQIATG
jgi:hypothetical protein